MHEGTQLRMPQVIQVFLSTSLSNLNALPSSAAMEGVNDLNPPTQAAKTKKVSKTKSKTTSGVSQKASVVKTTKSQPVGSEQVSTVGEGIGENQRTLKDKEGEGVKNQPNHATSSQKDVSINKESNTTLSTSSQKDLDIEKSSQPGAQNIGGDTQAKPITPYVRKKKGLKTQHALGEHTHAIPETSSLENVLLSSTIDASQANAEMQPHSLSIQFSPSHSHSQNSSDIFMIDNLEISNSPSLKIMVEPKIIIDTHHSEEGDLLEYQSFISSMVVDTVLNNQNLISQQPSTDKPSTTVYPSMASTSTANPSTDIPYPLTASTSMDIPSSSNPSLSDNVLSHLGTSYEEQIVISSLLGLSEGGKMSESLSCPQEKGEAVCEKPLISSELVSEKESFSLEAEEKGEVVRERSVSQDEILMQKQREIERNAGTEAKTLKYAQELTEELLKDTWGVEGPVLSTIVEEAEDSDFDTKSVDSAQKDLDVISREPHEFTHPIPTYQILASQSNLEAEQTLGLVHTEQSLRNAKANVASASTSAACRE